MPYLKLILGFFLFTFALIAFLFSPITVKTSEAHSIYCGIPPEPGYSLNINNTPSPTNVTASAVGQQITFSWSATTGCSAWWNGLASENFWRYSTATSVTFTGTCGTTYTPVVATIINVDLQSSGWCCNIDHPPGLNHSSTTDRPTYGNSVTATCAPPFTLTASTGSCNVSGTQNVNVSWSNPPASAQSFPIQRNTSPVYGGTTVGCVNAPGSTFVDNPPVGTWYYWTFGKSGTCGEVGSGSNSNIAGPVTTASCVSLPTVVTNPATAVTPTSATLNGNVSANGGADPTDRGFNYAVMPASQNCSSLISWSSTSVGPGGIGTFFTSVGSANGVNPGANAYCFRAYATNSAGTGLGGWLDFGLPGPFASSLTATAGCSGTTPTVNLVWGASPRATSYTILRDSSSIQIGWPSSPYLNNTGLANSTLYSYQIQAVNSAGSILSNTASATTLNCANPTVDLLVNGLLAGFGGSITIPSGDSANLTWTSANATTCNSTGSWASLGIEVLNNTSPGESTGTLVSPGPYTSTLTCTNGNNDQSAFDNVGINITAPLPWIQTTGGDVHSNVEINTPGGPTSTPNPVLAQMISPVPGSAFASSIVTFNWSAGSSALEYHLWVSTLPGDGNLYSQPQGLNQSVTVSGVPTTVPVYVRLWTRFTSGWQSIDYTYGP